MPNPSVNYKLTVFILSKGKNSILEKILEYWEGSGFRIIVLHETQTPINISGRDSSVLYLPTSDSINIRINKMSELIDTDYVLISPDDEVFSFSAIDSAIKFLDQNQDFSTVSGQTVAVSKYANQYNYFFIYRNLVGFETTSENSLGRVRESSEKTNNIMGIGAPYRIMRRSLFTNFIEALRELSPLSCSYLFEVLAEVYQNIHGKVKILDNVFWIRNWITPAGTDTKRHFYYFQWWESSLYSNEHRLLAMKLSKHFIGLTSADIDQILLITYNSRRNAEISEYRRLFSKKSVFSKIKCKFSRYTFIQRINFLYKPSFIDNLQIQLDKNLIWYDRKELLNLTNFVINLDKVT
jgi:hypothetical protein